MSENTEQLPVKVCGLEIGTAFSWDELDTLHHAYCQFTPNQAFLSSITHTPNQALPSIQLYEQVNINFETGEFALFVGAEDEEPTFTGTLSLKGAAS